MAEANKPSSSGNEKIEYWRVHIEGWKLSPLSIPRYCEQHGLPLYQFRYWRRRLIESKKNNPAFIEVKTERYCSYPVERRITISTPLGFSLSIQTTDFNSDLERVLMLTGSK